MCHRHYLHNPQSVSISKQKGMGLPAAIFIIVVLSLVVLALANLETRTGEVLGQDAQSMRALAAAESGAQAGMARLFGPGESGTGICTAACSSPVQIASINFPASVNGLNGCSAVVTCCRQLDDDNNGYFTVRSTGTCGSAGTTDRATRVVEVGAKEVVP